MRANPAGMRLRMLVASLGLGFLALAGSAAAATRGPGEPQGPFLLADAESGQVFAHFDALRPWYPASTTKLMTVYVAFRAVSAGQITLQTPVVYSKNAAAQPPSKMGFEPGSEISLDEALKIMMVKSANDIAVAVAETVGGSVDEFAGRMNEEARRLGMTRSHFVNPHGLPDERQVTTVRDMALLARALLVEFPQHRDYYKIHAIQLDQRVLKNFNPLLERYAGANGMKTGFICASGYNLVASARRGGRELIAVVFGEYGGKERAEHAAALLDQGFQSGSSAYGGRTTLAAVASGRAYLKPLDMRPFVCSATRAATASEANEDSGATEREEQVSRLGPPVYLGPPIRITVEVPAKYGEPGYLARLPRPRPQLASDESREGIADAFVPVTGGADAAPAKAIGSVLGAPSPLSGSNPD